MELSNKARFWTGAVMGGLELLGLTIFGLTLMDWSWLTIKNAFLILAVLGIVLYNALAVVLIWNGSKVKKK